MVLDGAVGSAVGGVVPLTWDAPQESDAFQDAIGSVGMATFMQNEYFIDRIVGKFFASPEGNFPTTGEAPPAVLLTAGLFIARAGDEQSTEGFNVPIGWGATNESTLSYNPDIPDTIREPWIWRRQWILANPAVYQLIWSDLNIDRGAFGNAALSYPLSTAEGTSSSLDGPHVDAKTKRRVRQDQRLWLTAWIQMYPRLTSYSIPCNCRIHFDYRIHGQMRKPRNRGTF